MKVDSPIRHCLHSIIRLDHLITTEHHSNRTVSLVIVLHETVSREGFSKSYFRPQLDISKSGSTILEIRFGLTVAVQN